jgi:hypothetical protein
MRGRAIPLLAWGAALALLLALNWVWTGDAIQVGSFGFAVAVVWCGGLALTLLSRREALRPGAPEPSSEPEPVPSASLGAVLVAIAAASIAFGLAFGRFLVYFGAGLLVASLGAIARERRAERLARRRWLERSGG